jgi:hypothetical protein
MTPKVTATLRKALHQLEAERQGIERQIRAIRLVLGESGQRRGPTTSHPRANATRPRMSASARRAVSQRMKAYWAKRRAEKAKPKR